MNLNLKQQNVLITGSSRGIGRAIAEVLLEEEANVILTGRNVEDLNRTAAEFEKKFGPHRVLKFCGDLQDVGQWMRLAKFLEEKIGSLDHLVCNIGSGRCVVGLQADRTEYQRMMDLNFFAAVNAVEYTVALLEKSAAKKKASTSVTFIGSICGREVLGCPLLYAAAKAALESFSKNISHLLGRKNIRVNMVTPGNILFPGSVWEKKLKEDAAAVEKMLQQEVPLKKLGTSRDIGSAVAFLVSGQANFVNGANWIIDGGQTRGV